jgi:asparagine synthase (glutamine-hydrolysing)
MCGIFGVFNYGNKKPVNRTLFKHSLNLIKHRGPDGEGFFYDDNSGIGLGHRRLSILDLETGDQPICNENQTIFIVFNGEIYNHKEIKKYLLQKGHIFKTRSDTEVIVHAYEEFGDKCVNEFNGIFAFAIWDANEKRVLLARDYFGVKPLYYSLDNEKLIFASEIKSILNYSKKIASINEKALNYCLTFRHTPAPLTLFNGINKLPASYRLVVNYEKGYEITRYWSNKIIIDRSKTEGEWIDLLNNQLEKAVKRQMMADVPVGLSLSGGVDSGVLLALMSKYQGKGVHAFTVSFEGGEKTDDESERARKTAEMFGAKFYHSVISSNNYSEFMDKYIWHLEEPVGNESAVAYYFVANMAKGVVKVLLNGQGADEPFAGYDRYLGMYYSDKVNFLPPYLFKVISKLPLDLNRKNQLSRFYDYLSERGFNNRASSIASILSNNQRNELFNEDFKNIVSKADLSNEIEIITDDFIQGNDLEKYLFYDMFSSLSENLLLSEDKMAMAASIEARVPFLDIDLVKTALSIPSEMKIKLGKLKYIHKKVCEKYLPKEIIYQRKIGFNNPVNDWLTNTLGDELEDYFLSENSITQLFLNKNNVLLLLDNHRKKKHDNKRFLYLLLSIEKWNNVFINK